MIATFAVYGNTIRHDFVLDDDVVFRYNRYVQSGLKGIPDIISNGFLHGFNGRNDQSYRPVVLIFFAIEKSFFGNNPTALHLLNVLYYGLLCCLLFYLLKLLMPQRDEWLLLFMALLFVVHPLHTEVVANIKGRDEILHALFLISSLVFVFKYLKEHSKSLLVYGLLSFFLALLCKEMAVTYIVLLPLSLWTFAQLNQREVGAITAYFFIPLFLYFILRNAILDALSFDEEMSIINNGLTAAENYSEQLATTFYIFGEYIMLLFYPHPLSWDYSYPHFPIVGFDNVQVLLTIGLLAISIVGSLYFIKKRNVFAFCILFFLTSFSIVSNFFILIGSTLGERFLFFPSFAICILIVLTFHILVKKIKLQKGGVILNALIIALLISYSFKTIDRNKDWENNETLFASGAEATPNNSRAIGALASALREKGERSQNASERNKLFQQAIELYQKSLMLYDGNADIFYNLGVTYMNINDLGNAITLFEQTLRLEPKNIRALNNLGVAYFRGNQLRKAERYFIECMRIDINFQSAYANLGAIYHNRGDIGKARRYYSRALELDANDMNTRNNLSNLGS